MHVQWSFSNKARIFVKKLRPHLRGGVVRGRSTDIHSSSGKDLWPYQRGWPLLRVATKRGTTVHLYGLVLLVHVCTNQC